ncbi:hypothetical protein PTTG_05415 [Puccinia triticina 1-1 BBBD Race 1]|uniref:MICOS complex subunit MIC12 n=2 Tax=Puccinia triticina TaxID=208348 RepID=A0A0C4EX67_PUCT1|nr:uncharacterized protein PtA15_7A401 [Puccinia triticina]OAV94770.1 hypothetical protein PTTG_05415 [Puccinia triticina 1-1 BBBD Race 1]WAQ86673.1 hypothetical protein PtA15_7A401 [Puccinia triticina]WAR56539.1 hypothetical protein PtB15_7B388 [Puccinia triticina]
MSAITQTAKGALIAGGSYYIIHAHIANRTDLIARSLQDLSQQFRTISDCSAGPNHHLLLPSSPFEPKPLSERIKLNWNRSILAFSQKAHQFNLSESTDRFIVFLKSKLETDSNHST